VDFDWLLVGIASGVGARKEESSLRAAWVVVALVLAHAALFKNTSVQDAFGWFFFGEETSEPLLSCLSDASAQALSKAVQGFADGNEIRTYLPYVLEPHGHVTRRRLERTAAGPVVRENKREGGVFYTPADIAQFIVSELAQDVSGSETWCDPACGTGVFLRAALSQLFEVSSDPSAFFDVAQNHIFGMDVSAIAVEMAGIVLLVDCVFKGGMPPISPFHAWRKLGGNLVCMDALAGDFGKSMSNAGSFALAASIGFDRLILNPPYGSQNIDATTRKRWMCFSGVGSGAVPVQLAFVEMMWRLTKIDGVSGAVLPLSVAANTQRAHRVFRKHLASLKGRKEFLFFDREPQSLFGEDVKTRNAILFVHKGAQDAVFTSSLLKWTAPQRPEIFTRSRLVRLPSLEHERGVPRLGSNLQVTAFEKIKSGYVLTLAPEIESLGYAGARDLPAERQERTLLIGSTAYNYVNCFPADALLALDAGAFSSSPLHAMTFADRRAAYAAYAVFSSRLCFWMWRVEGDGFHLSRDFLVGSPLWRALNCPEMIEDLGKHGLAQWLAAKAIGVKSVNGGKVSYSFPPRFGSRDAEIVEKLLLAFFGIERGFSNELAKVVASTVSIDGRCRSKADEVA